MIIRRQTVDQNLIINTESDFQTDLGWEDNLMQFEEEILNEIINPIENYETIRYIHTPYSGITSYTGDTQSDIWFYFFFHTGTTYNQDYQSVNISNQDNEHLLPQSTKSFFRLEFYKTPLKKWNLSITYNINETVYYEVITSTGTTGNTYTSTISNNISNNPNTSSFWTLTKTNSIVCEAPNRTNRKLLFAKNLSLPNGEKVFDPVLNGHLHIPIFTGSNYRNKENMYMFWFEDESVLTETNLSGSTTGNTFFMTAKFYDAENGSIYDFTNNTGYTHLNESQDMYYQVDIDKVAHTYSIFKYTTQKSSNRFGAVSGSTITPITFYQKRS